ncbi:MAG TPA: amidohydrolase family protein, partial [Acidimicrobiales bacterium]|nr:amidohydrolase family protein [Acidimicrobiales bacterium]
MKLDLLITNAHLLDPGSGLDRHDSCIGVLQGRIVGVGDAIAELDAHHRVDIEGATVLPGLYDSHVHTTSFGLGLSMLDLSEVTGMEPLLDAVAAYARSLAPDAWVIGAGYGLGLDVGTNPSRAQLDAAADGRPVWLTHFSGHLCVLSSAALAEVG